MGGGEEKFFNGADLNLFHSGTGSGLFWGLQCHVETDPNCFICYYRGRRKTKNFILDPSGRISIVHDSDLGSGYGTMRIRIQTMLFDCFYSDLLQKILNFCKISCKWYCPIGLAVQIDTGFFRSGSGQCSGIIADPDPKRLSSCFGYCLTFERLSEDGGAVNSCFEDLSTPQRDAEGSGCLPRHLQVHCQAHRLVDPPERRGVHLPGGDVVPGRRVLHLKYRKNRD